MALFENGVTLVNIPNTCRGSTLACTIEYARNANFATTVWPVTIPKSRLTLSNTAKSTICSAFRNGV